VPRITCPRCCQPHHRRRKRTPQFSHLCPFLTPHRLIISIRVFRTAAEADQVIADLAARFLNAAAHRARQPPVGLHPAPALASVYDLTSPSARAACGAVPHTPGSVPDTRNRPADHQPRSTRELRRPPADWVYLSDLRNFHVRTYVSAGKNSRISISAGVRLPQPAPNLPTIREFGFKPLRLS
jgi:hypothetical protein